jgi:hypothetical protein
MEETPKTSSIICRKCGGPHLTIKCGKESNSSKKSLEVSEEITKENLVEVKVQEHKKVYTDFTPDDRKVHRDRKPYFKTTYRVKLSGLPEDIDEEEMMHMTCDWGHIIRLKVLNYEENSVSYIDFGYEEEADYFVEAIDKTPFEYLILTAQRVSSEDPHNKKQTRE